MGSLWPIWSCMRTYYRFGRIDTIACEKERLTNPLKVLESGRDERRKDDHRHCRIIEMGRPISSSNYNFSVQNIKKTIYSAPEHARSILMVDLNSSKWRSIGWFRIIWSLLWRVKRSMVTCLRQGWVRGWISTVNGSMEQPVRQIF
jgi:hypothetical protein